LSALVAFGFASKTVARIVFFYWIVCLQCGEINKLTCSQLSGLHKLITFVFETPTHDAS